MKPFEGLYVVVRVCLPNVYALANQEGGLKGLFHILKLFKYIVPEKIVEKQLSPEEAAASDSELLEIRNTDTEEVPVFEAERGSEDRVNWTSTRIEASTNQGVNKVKKPRRK